MDHFISYMLLRLGDSRTHAVYGTCHLLHVTTTWRQQDTRRIWNMSSPTCYYDLETAGHTPYMEHDISYMLLRLGDSRTHAVYGTCHLLHVTMTWRQQVTRRIWNMTSPTCYYDLDTPGHTPYMEHDISYMLL